MMREKESSAAPGRPPVLAFAGYHNSGKTTVLMRLIGELNRRGITTAYLKHTHHEVDMPPKDRDSQKALAAGCGQSAVFSDQQLLYVQRTGDGLSRALELFEDADLILVEGGKKEKLPKVLVASSPDPGQFALPPEKCEAIICDGLPESAAGGRPVFSREDIGSLADWVVQWLQARRRDMDMAASAGNDRKRAEV